MGNRYEVGVPEWLRGCTPVNEALKLIDPEGMLVPGPRQCDRIREMIEIRLRQHSRDKVLEMARDSAKYLKVWWKVL